VLDDAADEAPFLRARAAAVLDAGARLHAELARECAPSVARAAQVVAGALRGGGKVLAFGNGQHLIAELVGRFLTERPALAGLALTADSAALTAIGNDYGFEHIFSRQIEGLAAAGDVAIAISTSGTSPNVLAGVRAAQSAGLTTIALVGGGNSELARLVDIPIVVPSASVGHVQECHLALAHAICDGLDSILSDRPDLALAAAPAPHKVTTLDELVVERERWRREGKVVVWTNGCFDLFHVGHLHGLQAARRLGDVLVVGLNDDASVRQLKGEGRPLIPAPERAALVGALEAVTRVVLIEATTPEFALDLIRPDVHCKGADYAPPDGKPMPERAIVESYGGRIEFLPWVDDASTSSLIERVRAMSPNQ
jgi:rfaE bifunctional protein nucleotidyltransferase chain/domain